MHTTISKGLVWYRSRITRLGRARCFALCIQANPRFTDVSIRESVQHPDRYFVIYRPANPVRAVAITSAQQDARTVRAKDQASQLRFRTTSRAGVYQCHSAVSETIYLVSRDACTCMDYQTRCRAAGLRCKHMAGLEAHLESTAAVAA